MSEPLPYSIDLSEIIRERSGKKIPRFVVCLLKKIVHEDFLNAFFVRGYEGTEFCEKAMEYLDIKLDVQGFEDIDASEGCRYTFASNHPLGGIDGVALGAIVGSRFDGKVKYLVNDLLMNIKGLAPICVPVNKIGAQSRELSALIDDAFQSDNQMLMFPAGSCSRRIDGIIQDIPWGKAFIRKSIETKRDVVPVHFIARNSERFYRIASWRKKLGIKLNIEMLTLPDEMYKARHSDFKVIFGKPIPYTTFDSSRSAQQWAQYVRDEVYKIQ